MPLPVIPSGVTIAWVGTNASIPSGWTRVTSLDGRFVKQIATSSTAPGATGGTSTHTHTFSAHSHTYGTHTHSGSWGTSPQSGDSGVDIHTQGSNTIAANGHTHGSTGAGTAVGASSNNSSPSANDAANNDPNHVTVIFIQSNGTPTGIPVNAVVWFNANTPTGFSAYTALDNRLMKGAAAGANGGTQAGATAHTHTSSTHTHPIGGSHAHTISLDFFDGTSSGGGGGISVVGDHSHTVGNDPGTANPTNSDSASETSGTGDIDPAWHKLRAIQKTGSDGIINNIIAMWTGALASIPTGWRLCDGAGGTPNLSQGKYVRGAATDGEVGNTGGAATHTHATGSHSHPTAATHNHTATIGSGVQSNNDNGRTPEPFFETGRANSHSHPGGTYTAPSVSIGTSSTESTTQVASSSLDPLFTGVAYIQFDFYTVAMTATATGTTPPIQTLRGKGLTVTATGTATMNKKLTRASPMTVTATGTATMNKTITTDGASQLEATATGTASIVTKPIKVFTVTATGTATISIQIGRPQEVYAISLTQFIKAEDLTQFIRADSLTQFIKGEEVA